MRIVVMGPSGAGKSLIGAALADELGLDFADADDLHTASHIDKMRAGIPLTDDDRFPWLDRVGAALASAPGLVMACSALTRRYRDRLRAAAVDIRFVELLVERDALDERVRERAHFMPSTLLDSQIATLEHLAADEPGVQVVNDGAVGEVVARARRALEDQSLR